MEYQFEPKKKEMLSEEELKERKEKRLEEKNEKNRRKGFEIPKGAKQGMSREKQFQDLWNSYDKTEEKKYNVKGRLDFSDLDEEEEEDTPDTQVKVPNRMKRKKIDRKERKDFKSKASRTPNSGATWHSKGDVKLSHALVEVKERGSVNARGEKTISIPKSWLTTQAEEAAFERRDYWYLAFAYKGDDEIYLIKPYDHEMEMVHAYENLQEEYGQLKADYEALKEEKES